MIEEHDLFERAFEHFPPPETSFDRLVARRSRRHLRKRVAAGTVGLVVAIVGIGLALGAIEPEASLPRAPLPGNGDLTFVGRDLSDIDRIYVVDPLGGAPDLLLDFGCRPEVATLPVCEDIGITSIDWSPDGTRLAFVSRAATPDAEGGASGGVFVLDAATGGVRRLTSCIHPCWHQEDVEWSPDGTRLAFTEILTNGCDRAWDFTGTCAILTVNADGTGQVRLPTGTVVDPVAPSWSPDGTRIVFSGRIDEEWYVYTTAADGSEPVRLASDLSSPTQNRPTWSPDGSRIAFLAWAKGGFGFDFDLWTIAPDGSDGAG